MDQFPRFVAGERGAEDLLAGRVDDEPEEAVLQRPLDAARDLGQLQRHHAVRDPALTGLVGAEPDASDLRLGEHRVGEHAIVARSREIPVDDRVEPAMVFP